MGQISQESGMDLAIVKMVLQHLVYFRVVQLTDLFMFSNVYSARSKLAELVYSPGKQRKYLSYLQETVQFEDLETMKPILATLSPIKLSSFLTRLTSCED